jgi:Tfp pilus assembly PilM family ATPase
VARSINVAAEAAELEAWPLPPPQGDGPNVMIAAASRAMVQKLLRWIDSQEYLCTRIDLAPLALMRACARMMNDLSTDRLWGVLDIGLRSSRFYLGLGETPVYVRNLRAGGDLMTRRIANELGVDPATAERFKRHHGIRAEVSGYRPLLTQQGPIDDRRMAGILLGILTPIVRGVAQDIERSFHYAMDLYPGLSVSDLVLVGGGSLLDGLPELLGKLIGIRVRRASADRLVEVGTNHPALAEKALPGMVTCLGLGYGELPP